LLAYYQYQPLQQKSEIETAIRAGLPSEDGFARKSDMAWYKGAYKDIYGGAANYTVGGSESKTVGCYSCQTYSQGMDITVKAGKLEMNAAVLFDDARWLRHDFNTHRNTQSSEATVTLAGVNLNYFMFFIVSCLSTNSVGRVVTSHGQMVWINANLVKFNITKNRTKFNRQYKERTTSKKIFHAIRYVKTGNEHLTAKTENIK